MAVQALTRRAMLRAIPAVAAAAIPGCAGVALAEPEHPAATVRRLSAELSAALAEHDGGSWHAVVHPGWSALFDIELAAEAEARSATLAARASAWRQSHEKRLSAQRSLYAMQGRRVIPGQSTPEDDALADAWHVEQDALEDLLRTILGSA